MTSDRGDEQQRVSLNDHIQTSDTCVGDSEGPFSALSPGDLTGRSHRGSEVVWLPGIFCTGVGTSLRLISQCLNL